MHYVYKITNSINGHFYIGYTSQKLKKRFSQHCTSRRNRMPICLAIQKHGRENFTIELLNEFETQEEAIEQEIKLIAELSPAYNAHEGGLGGPRCGENNGMFGRRHCEETKKVMSSARMGEKNGMFGRRHSPESIRKMSENSKGAPSWSKGKTGIYSEETLQKMRKPKTEEHKAKLRKPKSEEAKKNMRKPKSEQGKENMRRAREMKKNMVVE